MDQKEAMKMQETYTTPKSRSDGRGHPNTPIIADRDNRFKYDEGLGLNRRSRITRLEDLDPAYVELLEARFWAEVNWSDDADACWEWQGSTDVDGYGRLSVRSKLYRAHRLAYLLYYGVLNGALQVHHKVCDNRPCVNARHLTQGTAKENTTDAIAKGRHHVFGRRCAVGEVA